MAPKRSTKKKGSESASAVAEASQSTEATASSPARASQKGTQPSQAAAAASPAPKASPKPAAAAEEAPETANPAGFDLSAAGRKRTRDAQQIKRTAESGAPSTSAHAQGVSKYGRPNKAPLSMLVADNVAPAGLGITASALSKDESRLIAARTNGSLALYRVVLSEANERRIFNVLLAANTGGIASSTVLAVTFLGALDEFVLVAFGSGNVGLYESATLAPITMANRTGGVVRSFARADDTSAFAACADGATRRYVVETDEASRAVRLTVPQTLPKMTDCERALSVAVSAEFGIVVVGDDGRNITAWELRPPTERICPQKWTVQLPASYPLALAADRATVAIGTSMNEVVFVDVEHGVIVNTFEHHRGPVTVLHAAAGVFYASGWHESLRAYRAPTRKTKASGSAAVAPTTASDYQPADVKRRTHYHECTSILIGPQTGLALSTARDGTIMFTNLDKLFSHPASYVDSLVSRTAYTLTARELLLTHRDNTVQVYRILATSIVPLASLAIDGPENVRGLWTDAAGTRLCVATDSRVVVFALTFEPELNKIRFSRLASSPVPSVGAACFVGPSTCVVANKNTFFVLCVAESVAKDAFSAAKLATSRGTAAQERAAASVAALSIGQVFTTDKIRGTVNALALVLNGSKQYLVVATSAPGGVYWLSLAENQQGDVAAPAQAVGRKNKKALVASSTAPAAGARIEGVHHVSSIDNLGLAGPIGGADGEVVFLNPTEGKFYGTVVDAEGKVRTSAVSTDKARLPVNVNFYGRTSAASPSAATKDEPLLAFFSNGLVEMRRGDVRWNFLRASDRTKARPNDVKARMDFASFVPKAVDAPWARNAFDDDEETQAQTAAGSAGKKAHRREKATIALDDEASDAEGSDDGNLRDPAAASANAIDASFSLRRNIPGVLDGLPLMWRVRRFGN
jgi:hypothetical protein